MPPGPNARPRGLFNPVATGVICPIATPPNADRIVKSSTLLLYIYPRFLRLSVRDGTSLRLLQASGLHPELVQRRTAMPAWAGQPADEQESREARAFHGS